MRRAGSPRYQDSVCIAIEELRSTFRCLHDGSSQTLTAIRNAVGAGVAVGGAGVGVEGIPAPSASRNYRDDDTRSNETQLV